MSAPTTAGRRIVADDVPAQRWKNGGGTTRELLCDSGNHSSNGSDWRWRISLADIAADGPFSPFPGVQRWFAVLDGDGVELTFADRQVVLRRGNAPLCFDGAAAPACRLLNGPTRDINLMLRGIDGALHGGPVHDGSWPLRGRFDIGTRTLHWGLPPGRLQADAPSLWIGIAA